jgi:gliding motility-associated-like protein
MRNFILLSLFLISFLPSFSQINVTASFTAPDTVCISSPVNIQNTSQGATNYYWSFCTANINQPPIGTNLGNVGGLLSAPVYIDYVFTNGNYYGFVTNNSPGGLVRLDFGNSLLNAPVVTSLGSIGGVIPNNTEGVQIANDNGNWYVLIVGGDALAGSIPSLTTVSLGTNIANNTPTATNWGNIGNLSYPHDLYVFNDNGHWYGLTVNYSNSTITRFDLTTSLSNSPTAVNLGNIGNLSGPTGIQAINDNGNWRVFITNATTSTLARLDFGSSLLNIPTGVNLGNPGNAFSTCWDIYILRYCGENEAFVINATGSYDIVKLDFGSSLLNSPTAVSLGNQGNLDFPHCISKLFRVGPDVFSFITNVINNTLTLLEFPGCTNASIPNSTAQNPAAVTYNPPGVYNINLTVDDGLPTQSSYCKRVVVKDCDNIINDYTPVLGYDICKNELKVADATKYNPGDTVLLIQMKGAIIDSSNTSNFGTITNYRNSGNYEFNYVKQKTGNLIELKNVVTRQYDIADGKVQLVRVPYYKSLNINSELTCLPWDGSIGGVLAFNVKDTLTMNADIDVTGKGFFGGKVINPKNNSFYCHENDYYYPNAPLKAAPKGEGIAIISDQKIFGKGALSNGGGGGLEHNSGGGGGSNTTNGGQGGKEWITCGPPIDNGGIGGKPLTYSNPLNTIFLGGGGGAGHCDNPPGFNPEGGNGGGIIIIKSNFLKTNNYLINSSGASGIECIRDAQAYKCHEGMGGGGGGGTILLDANNLLDNANVQINGGKGADMNGEIQGKLGPGGGGGGGLFWFSKTALPGNIIVTKNGGINGVNIDFGNDSYGATPGQSGRNLFSLKIPIDTVLFKKNIDSIRIKDSAASCTSFNFKGLSYTNSSLITKWQWSFGDGSIANTQNTSHTYAALGNFVVKLIGTDINGCKDSAITSVTVNCLNSDNIINDYTGVLGLDICKNQLTVTDATKYNPGDTVLLIQMKGGVIDSSNTSNFGTITNYKNAGNYEFNYVKQKTGNVIELKNLVTRQYDIPAGKVQLVRVPYYASLNITNRLTCLPWNGSIGGVLAFNVKDTLTMNADIDVSGKGFIGGNGIHTIPPAFNCYENQYYYPPNTDLAAAKGEGIAILSSAKSYGKGKCANGGGGGNSHNSGGGGGSNAASAGFGGYEFEGSPCDGTVPFDNRGIGGTGLTYNNLSNKVFLGGGGGAGHANNPELFYPKGGNGGGICIISASSIKGNNKNILANGDSGLACTGYGATGCHEGMGGGGGAGTILLNIKTYNSVAHAIAKGGSGADMVQAGNLKVGPGGGGSGGVCWLNNLALPANLIPEVTSGANGVCTAYANNAWGTTSGQNGLNLFSLKIPVDTVLFKKNIDSVRIKDSIYNCNSYNFKGISFTETSPVTSWAWSFGDGTTANTQNTSHTYASGGTFPVKLVVTDINGCKDSILKSFTTSVVNITKSNDTSLCGVSPVQLLAGGGVSYSWTPASTLNNPGINNPVATPLATTIYRVIVTNAAGCTKTDSVKIAVNSFPVITKSNDTSVCSSSPAQLIANGGSIYSWTPASTLSNPGIFNPVATPTANTLYYVTVTNAAGCSKKDSIKITVKNLPVITKSKDTGICLNSTAQLLAGGGSVYSWTPASSLNNPNISNPVATPLVTTSYHVTVTNAGGCPKMDSIKITVNRLPVVSTSNDMGICNNSPVQLLAGGGTSYSWMPVSTLNNPNIYNPVATPSATTTYYVTVTNAAGCTKLDSIKISTSAPPVITKSNDTVICRNTSAQLFAAGGSTYLWTPASSLNNAGIPNPMATPNTFTTYYVIVTNASGCSKSDSVKIGINPVPVVTKSNDTTICNQTSVKIFATGGNSYLWSPASSLDNPTSNSPVASPLTTTLYKVTITDARTCNYKDSVKVSIRSAAIFTVSPGGSVCSGTPKQLQASGGDSYLWTPAADLNNPNISNPVATPGVSTTYTVTIHKNTCNETGSLTTDVMVLPGLSVKASSSNDLSCSQGSSQLTAAGASNYLWTPATGLNNSNIGNPIAMPSSTTLYKVTGKAINGCSGSDTVTVKVNFTINALYLLPNSFTPNNDGINDCFGIKYWGAVRDIDFSIYNRFGEKVFHTNDPAICWDGTYKQKLQEPNVFVYIIKAKTTCGNVERKGIVALIR